MKNNRRDAFLVLSDQAVFSGTSFVFNILCVNLLSAASFGQFSAYILTIYLIISGLNSFVIQPLQTRIGYMPHKSIYIAFTYWFQLLLSLVVLFIVFLVNYFLHLKLPSLIYLYAFGFIFYDYVRKVLLAINKINKALLVDVLYSISLFLSVWYFYSMKKNSLDGFIYLLSVVYVVPVVLSLFVLRPFYFRKNFYLYSLNRHLKDGKWLFFSAISQWWASNLYVVSSGFYLGKVALGAFRFAQSILGTLNVLLQTIENYILPRTAEKLNVEFEHGLSYLASFSRKWGIALLAILVLIYIYSSEILLVVGGSVYSQYAFVLQGLSLLYVFVLISQPLRVIIRSLNLNNHFFYGYLISLFFAIIFSNYLLSNFQLIGSIVGMIISQIILVIYWSLILKNRKLSVWKLFI